MLSVECSNVRHADQYILGSNMWVSAGRTGATLPQACPGSADTTRSHEE